MCIPASQFRISLDPLLTRSRESLVYIRRYGEICNDIRRIYDYVLKDSEDSDRVRYS